MMAPPEDTMPRSSGDKHIGRLWEVLLESRTTGNEPNTTTEESGSMESKIALEGKGWGQDRWEPVGGSFGNQAEQET